MSGQTNIERTVADLPDSQLVERAVRSAVNRGRNGVPAWVKVMEAFALGSTYARQLCARFGIDPDSTRKTTYG